MTFRIMKRKYFWGKKNSKKMKNLDVAPPPPHGLMKRALGGFKKNSPALKIGKKKILRLT